MAKAVLRVFMFLVALICLYVYVGYTITSMTGGFDKAVAVEGVNAEAGEQIFFGKGKCSTCHSIGDKGSAIRCPNLGVQGEQFPLAIGERAAERAAERSKQTGKQYRPVDYLFECVGEPGAYVVQGFKNEMPIVYQAPIGLTPDEVKAVIMFLASQGGDIPADQILNPTGIAKEYFSKIEAAAASGATEAAPFEPYLPGDPEKGKNLFWDISSKAGCAKCHTVGDKGGQVGPALTSVAGTRVLKYIVESIVKPSAVIVSGYEPVLVMTKTGERIAGTKKEDTPEHFVLGLPSGEVKTILKSDVEKSKIMETSIMPGNFAEILSVEEFHDVLAYVRTLTGESAPPPAPAAEAAPAAPAEAPKS
ncbi:MAG: c-type cytochrome [Nitrospinae bacterium]|nr:c-type cytochrome [Nitrospinota bacterium]